MSPVSRTSPQRPCSVTAQAMFPLSLYSLPERFEG